MSNLLEVIVDDDGWLKLPLDIEKYAKDVFAETVEYMQQNDFDGGINCRKFMAANLSLSNDAQVKELNAEFRKKDKPTNILSFANIDDDNFPDDFCDDEMLELGDMIMSLETLQKEAEIKKISLQDHFAHLLVHGILHLSGYDHQNDDEAEEMEAIEIDILHKMGIGNPYADEEIV